MFIYKKKVTVSFQIKRGLIMLWIIVHQIVMDTQGYLVYTVETVISINHLVLDGLLC